MPLYPGGPKLGLGLWNSVAGTIVVETAMFVVGVWMYVRATRARDAVGRYGLPALLAVLVLSYIGSLVGGTPSSMRAVAIGGIVFGWLFVGWAAGEIGTGKALHERRWHVTRCTTSWNV